MLPLRGLHVALEGVQRSDVRGLVGKQVRAHGKALGRHKLSLDDGTAGLFAVKKQHRIQLDIAPENAASRNQLYMMRPDGGEARQATAHHGGASSPSWSPDSRRIAFVGVDEPDADEPFGAPVTIGEAGGERIVHDIRYRYDGKGFLTTYSHIWAVDVATGDPVRLTLRRGTSLDVEVLTADQSLKVLSGSRHMTIKAADLGHYAAERGRRGSAMVRGRAPS